MWNFGYEAWCNLEGQYVTIVADLSPILSATSIDARPFTTYEMKICSLGVMGTKYIRSSAITDNLTIAAGQF